MLVLIDNYDSFTHNLARYFRELGYTIQVYRNDEIDLDDLHALAPAGLVISPGPCTPNEAGISLQAIASLADTIPVLGVCLGHQALAQVFGGAVIRAPKVMHGKRSLVSHHGTGLFAGLPEPLQVTRYHSLVVDPASLPDDFNIDAWVEEADKQVIMAISHQQKPLFGVQFHPESVLTQDGHPLLDNFCRIAGIQRDSSKVKYQQEAFSSELGFVS